MPPVQASSSDRSRASLLKDEVLNSLAENANVAQFVSFGRGDPIRPRHLRLRDAPRGAASFTPPEAIHALLERAPEGTVNIRTFDPARPKNNPFLYGIDSVSDAWDHVQRFAVGGWYTIVNETVNVNDGGVSGVLYGGVAEFAPGDTPRAVEKAGVLSLTTEMSRSLLKTVYGIDPELEYGPGDRVEFSVHPLRRGIRHSHTLIWELERRRGERAEPALQWPNRFSRLIGDKAFGLLMADAHGLFVPRTTVIPRHLPPFTFGTTAGTAEVWMRTCPAEPVPGRFTTSYGWRDPYALLQREDPTGESIVSVIAQEGVEAAFSGAVVGHSRRAATIEGVAGRGDAFMLGRKSPDPLPARIYDDVEKLYHRATAVFGPVRLEWVHDRRRPWVVQLHQGKSAGGARMIYPGRARHFQRFDASEGIEALRALITRVKDTGDGITVVGDVGITSHFADLLRGAAIPSRLKPNRS